ncbi:MAG: hypothetical protein GOU99_03300, partial [Candidatus Altiarchaeota archaeon]|nr:hypothetical protein [Candidatus Altiarchaeota archaeon]
AVEHQEIESEIAGINIKFDKLKSNEKEVEYDKQRHIMVSESFDETNKLFSSFSERGIHLPVRINDLSTIITKIEQEISDIDSAKQKLDKKTAVFGSLAILHNSLKEVQVIVREHFVEMVNSSLSEVWSQLYPYRDYLGLRIFISRQGTKEGDYVLQLREPAGWVNVEGVASGGERSMAALALRVALAKAMTGFGLLLLDEPTHNLDRNGMEKLIQILRDGMPNVLEQVVLITHNEEMEKAATGFAYKFERQKELEEPTRVVKV